MKVGIFASAGNGQAQALRSCIDELGPGSARCFPYPTRSGPRVSIEERGVYWDDTDVGVLDTAYIHGFAYENPVLPRARADFDWSVWQDEHSARQQTYSFLHSAFEELARRGVKLVNPPRVHVKNFLKADLMEDLRAGGFKVPISICTNDLESAQLFCAESGAALWRPATGRASWQRFLEKQCRALMATHRPPVLLAQPIEGPLIRCYLLFYTPVLCLRRELPHRATGAERLEILQATDCSAVYATLGRLANRIGAPWLEVLFVLHDDEPWIYDVDTDPLLEWLPIPYRKWLIAGLARALMGEDPLGWDHSAEGGSLPQARPTLFCRQMLQPLFEMEATKYLENRAQGGGQDMI